MELPEAQMKQMIGIFKKEQEQMSEINLVSPEEAAQMDQMVKNIHDAGKKLQHSHLMYEDQKDRIESAKESEKILGGLDKIKSGGTKK